MAKKAKKWVKPRHRFFTAVIGFFFAPVVRLRYHIKIRRFTEQNGRQYLVLMNHQTPFDQFFVALSFRGPLYYLATEDLFSNGFVSRLIEYLVAPIPIKKQTVDVAAVISCLKVARQGGTIALCPEGNRTFSGKTEYINPSIVALAKKLALPIALYRIEGGYGAHPRWSDRVRRGPMQSGVVRVLEPQEYLEEPDDVLYKIITDELYVDEARTDASYRNKHLAEHLERCVFVCPECGISEFESVGDTLRCKRCSLSARYLATKELAGTAKPLPYRFVNEWYEAQKKYINALDFDELTQEIHYEEIVTLSEVIPAKKKILLEKNTTLHLNGNRLEIPALDLCCPIEDVDAITVLSRNKLNLYYQKKVYQMKGTIPGFNALKYVLFYHRFKNLSKGEPYAEFLGL